MEFSALVSSPPAWKQLRPLFEDGQTAEMARPFLAQPRRANLTLLHLNHSIRKKADEEAQWVRGFAHRHSVACVIEKVDVPSLAQAQKRSLEEAGRTARYRLLTRYLEDDPRALGFTGHTLDDHTESVLFNLVEQTGLGGLLGIAPALHRCILRPFLSVTKQELADFLLARGQVFLTDESNLVPDRPRTFLRHEVIPRLKEINPRVRENILATSAHLADYEGLFNWALRTLTSLAAAEDTRLRRQFALPLLPGVGHHLLSIALWKKEIQESLSVVLGPILSAFGHDLPWHDATELTKAIRMDDPWTRAQPGQHSGIQFHPPASLLIIVSCEQPSLAFELEANSKLEFAGTSIILRKLSESALKRTLKHLRKNERFVDITQSPGFPAHQEEVTYEAVLSSRVALPLHVRSWRRGDRIALSRSGSAKLSDVFTDRKIPRILREHWPVVTDSRGGILWLPGLVRTRLARVGAKARSGYLLGWQVNE